MPSIYRLWDRVSFAASRVWWAARRRIAGKRPRKPGEIVARRGGSCFCGSDEPRLVRLTDEGDGDLHDIDPYCCLCSDPYCCEWANVQITEGPHRGDWMFHLNECQMEDPTPEDWERYNAERGVAYYREWAANAAGEDGT